METRFLDPLYGVVRTNGMEAELLLTPEVQRLRYIRMCNINSLLICGASEVSRFEHIVGVLHLAKRWTIQHAHHAHDGKLLHAAAILHDMQTGPFGHSLEYILDDNAVAGEFSHEDVQGAATKTFLQSLRAAASFRGSQFHAKKVLGSDWNAVTDMIRGRGKLGPLVSAELDIDNIDNVLRLAYHVGLIERHAACELAEAIVFDMQPLNGELTLSDSALPLVARWQEVRAELYSLLLHDWAEFSAKAMLTRVIEEAVKLEKLGADNWILTDDGLIEHLGRELIGDGGAAKEVLDRLVRGALFEPALLARISGTDGYDMLASIDDKRMMEAQISSIAGSRAIFHVIKDKKKTHRAIRFFNRTISSHQVIGQSSDETLIGVFLSGPEVSERIKKAIEAVVQRRLLDLGIAARMTPLADPTAPYERERSQNNRQLGLFDGS
jgi:HD superfamily phosphohydrolase